MEDNKVEQPTLSHFCKSAEGVTCWEEEDGNPQLYVYINKKCVKCECRVEYKYMVSICPFCGFKGPEVPMCTQWPPKDK